MAVTGRADEFFDDLETMSAGQRDAYQSRELARTVAHAYRHTPAVKATFERSGLHPDDIRHVRDLEKLPVTRKADIIEKQKESPPYGGFLAIPPEEIERVFLSPGPVYEPIQHSGIRWFAKSFWAAGFRKGDVVVNTFTYHLSPAGILFHEAARDCGATVVPMGTGSTEIQVRTMYDLNANGFVGTPSFLMALIKRSEEMGYNFRRDFNLRRAWFTGEMLPPSLRRTFADDYTIDTYQTYAVTESGGALAYECRCQSGMHFMDEYVIEIIDPDTGKQLGPGETGEVVVTPIHNRVWGLVRFGTGDLGAYTDETCACGRTSNRLTGILGRAGDAVKVRGMFVVARQAAQICAGFDRITRFQLLVTRPEYRDEVSLQIELKGRASKESRKSLAADLAQRFQEVCRLKLDAIEFVPKGSIAADAPAIDDRRRWE